MNEFHSLISTNLTLNYTYSRFSIQLNVQESRYLNNCHYIKLIICNRFALSSCL